VKARLPGLSPMSISTDAFGEIDHRALKRKSAANIFGIFCPWGSAWTSGA
jgi:hypothetical protein